MARLRLQAGNSILKLVQEQCYQDLVTLDQFQTVAILLNVSAVTVQRLLKNMFSKSSKRGPTLLHNSSVTKLVDSSTMFYKLITFLCSF